MSTDRISLVVSKREVSGKKVAKLREQGIIPAVIYGADFTPVNVEAPIVALQKTVAAAGMHTPVELVLDGKKQTAIIKTIDVDHVRNRLQHISFQAVSKDEIVTTRVPIVIDDEDESEAKKAGLIILQSVEDLEIKAKPDDLPEALHVSAASLHEHGDKLTVADVAIPDGVELVDPDDDISELTIASVYEPSALAAANEQADEQGEAESTEAAAENVPSEQGENPDETKEKES
jgi:large subunit ribosomal protein L25